MPRADVELSAHRRITTMVSKVPAMDENFELDTTGEKFEEGHLVTTSCGPGMTYQTFERWFTLVMQGTITPIERGKVLMRWSFAQPEQQTEHQRQYAEATMANIVEQVGHDVPIWENKIYQQNPILCDGDGPVAKYRKWFSQFYDEGTDSSPIRLVQ